MGPDAGFTALLDSASEMISSASVPGSSPVTSGAVLCEWPASAKMPPLCTYGAELKNGMSSMFGRTIDSLIYLSLGQIYISQVGYSQLLLIAIGLFLKSYST